MASRVTVAVNVRDNSRAGIRQVRNAIRRMNDDIRRSGGTADFRVDVNARSIRQARRRVAALRRQLDGLPVTINTVIRTPRRSGVRGRVVGALTTPFRQAGAALGGILSDGLGQGIISGIRAGGPVFGTAFALVLIGVLTAALAVVGAALSGLLVTALGAAFVGIGAVSAFQSKQVQQTWSRTLANIKEEFKGVGEPLIPVLDRALKRLHEMAHVAGPALKEALQQTAPATEEFFNSILTGFEKFGGQAFDRIMEAWNVFAPVFGEEWEQFMTSLGDAFGDMADLVKEHPTEIAAALDIVFSAITGLIRIITFFGNVWVTMMQAGLDMTALGMKAFANLGIIALNAMEQVFNGLTKVIGLIPGMGDKMEGARRAFATWKEGAVANLNGVKQQADILSSSLDRANKRRKLEADIRSWQSSLQIARADLSRTSNQKARAKLTANISDLEAKIASARRQLNNLNGKTAVTWVITNYEARKVGSHGSQLARAHGGVVGTAATGGVRNNMTLVGEAGPELVDLPAGSRVRSNPDTRRLMGDPGTAGGSTLVLQSSGRRVDDMLIEILREAIHQRGGDPVTVLGG